MVDEKESDKVKNQLKLILSDLEGKQTKKAQKQRENIERYLEYNGEDLSNIKKEIKGKAEEKTIADSKNKIPPHVYTKEHNFPKNEHKREIDENGEIQLLKLPTMVFLQLHKPEENYFYEFMEKAQKLQTYCIAYPIFKYSPNRHCILIQCDICYYAFKTDNLFCEYMVKISRLAGYGFKGPQLFNPLWTLGKLGEEPQAGPGPEAREGTIEDLENLFKDNE